MTDEIVNELLKRHERLKSDRALFDQQWREVAERVLPEQNNFLATFIVPGQRRNQRIFDSTAQLALPKFAAAMESMLTPASSRWHGLRCIDPEVDERPDVRLWCEAVTELLFRVRESPTARFQQTIAQAYRQIGAYGNGIIYVNDDVNARKISYRALDLARVWWYENSNGAVDVVHREYKPQVRHILQDFGKLPPILTEKFAKKQDQEVTVVHCVHPSTDKDYTPGDYKRWPFISTYFCVDTKEILDQGGFNTNPYCIGRYDQAPQEVYGRGPAMMCLPEIKMLNEMRKTIIRQAQKAVDPPLLANDDGMLRAWSMQAGAINWGGVDDNGKALVVPMHSIANFEVGQEMIQESRQVINAAFMIDLFQILVDKPDQMTATEAALRAQEKGELLGPSGGRLQSDMLGPLITRELDILFTHGAHEMPPMPDILLELGGLAAMRVEYVAPLNMAQRASDGLAFLNAVNTLTPLETVAPGVLSIFDPEATGRGICEIGGVPQKWLRTPDQMAQMKAQQASAAQTQQISQELPAAASAAKDLASAHATASSVPQPLALPMQ